MDGKPYQHEAMNVVRRSRGFHPNQSIAVEYAYSPNIVHIAAFTCFLLSGLVPLGGRRCQRLQRCPVTSPVACTCAAFCLLLLHGFRPAKAGKGSRVGRLGAGWIRRLVVKDQRDRQDMVQNILPTNLSLSGPPSVPPSLPPSLMSPAFLVLDIGSNGEAAKD